ncbi:conserved Plasmodium protein, unknown function [Plasmodium gallinaceum]|uniref:Uncharacterized protein n=1 Tax=Plasmodium gallinaceum TaxID=5849 RepID=A0A1J1H198_PLAGA|nr:conserved Plasmodium protein, unknown function [Plasmodium gallinaceum]CRG97307.1 conserved Plasmodium protein, unknown function [Plasmodium gallinaceum]
MFCKLNVQYHTIGIYRLLCWRHNKYTFFFSSFKNNEKKENKTENNKSKQEDFSFEKNINYIKEDFLNDRKDNHKLTNVIFNKIVDEYKLNEEKKDGIIKKIVEGNNSLNKNQVNLKENNEYDISNTEIDYYNTDNTKISKNENYILTENEITFRKKKLISNNVSNKIKKNNELTCSKQDNIVINELDKKNSKREKLPKLKEENEVNCTIDKNINNILVNYKSNKLILNEKKKNDHFYKIFFSSKKVKIIKSQNHPIFIHLYKLATNMSYREKQEKILLTNKKIILEREKNHITRIYTNSINNLQDFHSFDNFILLSNKLLKKLSFLYSFKNGVLAEIYHKFHFDNVGLPFLAFCFYNVNYEGKKKKEKEIKQEIIDENLRINYHYIKNKKDTSNIKNEHQVTNDETFTKNNVFCKDEDTKRNTNNIISNNIEEMIYKKEEDLEYLCNGDIGTLIRTCFLLKWQCIFNIDDLSKKGKKKNSSYKNIDINQVYDIDFFHPFTIRASSGYLLDIPYKNTDLNEIYKYTKENKILLLKYNSNSDLYINYKKDSHKDDEFLNLLKKSKGVFLIMDNCNNIEKKYKLIHKNYINISNNSHESEIFDNIYYVNLKNESNKKLGLISAYSIFMYILKVNYFKHIPQSSYVYFQQ